MFSIKRIICSRTRKNTNNKLFEDIEIPLVPVLAAMETEGINLDVFFLEKTCGDAEN
jgi:DNA polymerase-1